MRFGDLTYHEIAEQAASGTLAIVPLGCTEQQGPQVPVDFDTWFSEQLIVAVSETAEQRFGRRSLVLPALPFGPTPEHRGFGAGYIDLPQKLRGDVIRAILRSLAAQGFRRIVVWPGCGGHDVQAAVDAFSAGSPGTRVFVARPPFAEIWKRFGMSDLGGGHADSFTTSVMLYLRPADVRTDEIPSTSSGRPDWTTSELDFSRHSDTGVIGDARYASAELGERLWHASVEWAAQYLRDAMAA